MGRVVPRAQANSSQPGPLAPSHVHLDPSSGVWRCSRTARWRCKHTFIDGQQLVFAGTAIGLSGLWIKWALLSIITIGIYLFWVAPRIQRWKTEHTDFATPVAPLTSWSASAPAAIPATA